jgi:hypothetical protein
MINGSKFNVIVWHGSWSALLNFMVNHENVKQAPQNCEGEYSQLSGRKGDCSRRNDKAGRGAVRRDGVGISCVGEEQGYEIVNPKGNQGAYEIEDCPYCYVRPRPLVC